MTKKTHIAAGLAFSAPIMMRIHLVSKQEYILGSLAAITASTLPDADIYDGRPANAVEDITKMAALCFLLQEMDGTKVDIQALLMFAVALIIVIPMPHRGFSHSIICGGIFTGIFFKMTRSEVYSIWFGLSYLSHLLIDLLNKKGEPLFWPFPNRYCIKVCKADGMENDMLFIIFLSIYFISLYSISGG